MTIEEHPEHFNNTRKADFKSIYNHPDPRLYFAALTPLKYQIPQHALPFVRRVLEVSCASSQGTRAKVLDVCCSYGTNAALLRHDVDLDSLAAHYASAPELSPREQIAADKRFFADRARGTGVDVVGLDVAPEAISYGVETGLMSAGFAENLETCDPSPAFRQALRGVGAVICTGGVGYVGASTFSRIAASVDDASKLWIVMFVLRVFPMGDIVDKLEGYGLVTEKVPGVLVRQRRFANGEEQRAAVAGLRERGLCVEGLEGDGWFWAECWVSRPKGVEVGGLWDGLVEGEVKKL